MTGSMIGWWQNIPNRIRGVDGGLPARLRALVDVYGGVYAGIQDESGTVMQVYNPALPELSLLASSAYPGPELVVNGGFDTDSDWTLNAGWSIYGGKASCDGSQNPGSSNIRQVNLFEIDQSYELSFSISNHVSGAIYPYVGASLGTTRTANGTYTETIVCTGNTNLYLTASPTFVGSIDNVSVHEVNPLTGTYSGVTLAQPGPADLLAGAWDGINDYADLYSAALDDLFNPAAGTLLAFVQVANSGVWTDGSYRYVCNLWADTNNRARLYKANADSTFEFAFSAGGATAKVTKTGLATTDWTLVAMTWDGDLRAYWNGLPEGTAQPLTGTWSGDLDPDHTLLGAFQTVPYNVWHGGIAHWLLLRAAASPADILAVAQEGGVAA